MGILKFFSFSDTLSNYMSKIYALTFIGTLLTFVTAFIIANTPVLLGFVSANLFLIFVLQLASCFIVPYIIHKKSYSFAISAFLIFNILLGLTFSTIFAVFTGSSILTVLASVTVMFAGLSIYGFNTTKDLQKYSKFFFMTLLGLLAVMIINIFITSSLLNIAISVIGVLLFSALISYDTQRIKQDYENSNTHENYVIEGATSLYLNFINLFQFILSLVGIKK